LPRFRPLPRPLLFAGAILLAIAATAYACIWIHYIRILPQNVIGVAFRPFSPRDRGLEVAWVARNSSAGRAGLMAGDRILTIDARQVTGPGVWVSSVLHGTPGSTVVFTVARRSGASEVRVRLPIPPPELARPTAVQQAVMTSLLAYPLFFLSVGMAVLFLRPGDRNAWLLAAVFAGFVGLANFMTPESELLVPSGIRRFALAYYFASRYLLPALFYYFFAVFPVSSPLDRKAPWLKWTLTALAVAMGGPLVVRAVATGSHAGLMTAIDVSTSEFGALAARAYGIVALLLGLLSLIWNGVQAPNAEARRKARVLVAGTIAGVLPLVVLSVALLRADTQANPFDLPFWGWVGGVIALMLVPMSFAYAVLKHRVMEIPVLLKRSARYVLVKRGFALFVTGASAAAAWAAVEFLSGFFKGWFGQEQQVVFPAAMTAAGFGGVLALTGARVQRGVRDRIDRAFFRSAYDARQILEDLAQRIRDVRSSGELESLVEKQVRQALSPSSLAVFIESAEGSLATNAGVPRELRTLLKGTPAFEAISSRGRPFDVSPSDLDETGPLAAMGLLRPDCVVPMFARDGRLVGVIVLGDRLSEESYSTDDRRLLASVANQSGLAIESIRLAEAMAHRLEQERRSAHELEMAKLVQARLLLQRAPLARTLEYAGRCVQARAVGGDYYDFFDVGRNRIAIALADVSGKGLPAALLMASVQATLRTHAAGGEWDLRAVVLQMNRLLYESTAPEHFVTLFLGEYDDATRRLRYVNCGHNPPVLLAREGGVQRLPATACVLGAFPGWQCGVEEVGVAAGDLLAIFTDGITEAISPAKEDFGDDRLIAALEVQQQRLPGDALESVIRIVQDFAGGEQSDDLTLILARGV
jgi:sigma-B regulation protein RsbU (phosphoserine phosphatase)